MVTTPRPHDDDEDANLVAVSVEDTGRTRAIKARRGQGRSRAKGKRPAKGKAASGGLFSRVFGGSRKPAPRRAPRPTPSHAGAPAPTGTGPLNAPAGSSNGKTGPIPSADASAPPRPDGGPARKGGAPRGKAPTRPLRPQTPDWLTSPAVSFLQAAGLAGLAVGALWWTGVFHDITTTTIMVKYLGGKTPIDAAVDVARRDFNSAKTVLVVHQDDFADGTIASGLAGAMHAPLLLSDPQELTPRTLDVIREINPERVILLGGESLLSPNIETQLKSQIELEVVRLAGADIQNTMIAVDQEVTRLTKEQFGRATQRGVLVDPKDLFNAAAAGALAADWKNPAGILLADGSEPIPESTTIVQQLGLKEVFGLNATIGGVTMHSATNLAELASQKARQDGNRLSSVFLVPQDDTHRAMLAAPAAGKAGGVVLPVNNDATLAWLRDACPKISTMTLLAPDGEFIEDYNKAIDAAKSCGAEVDNPKQSVALPIPEESAAPGAGAANAPTPTPTPSIHLPATTVAPEAPAVTEDPQAIQDALAPAAPEG